MRGLGSSNCGAHKNAQHITTVDGRAAVPVLAASALLVAARITLALGVLSLALAVPLTLALAFAVTRVSERRAKGQGQ